MKEAEINVSKNGFLDMDDKKWLNLFMKELGIDHLNPQSKIAINSHTYESFMNRNIAKNWPSLITDTIESDQNKEDVNNLLDLSNKK